MNEIKVEPYIPDEDYDNPAMVVDFYEFTMANCLFLHGFKDTTLVFDMFFRKNPDNQGYSISAGQRKLTRFLLDYHFNEQDIHWLRTKGMSEEFCEYLRTYKWKGDMYALPEGTVCYPHVQMVRIECDLVGAILIETYLLQTMNFHSLIATKATRVTGLNTHTPRSVMEFGTRRAQGESAGNDGAYVLQKCGMPPAADRQDRQFCQQGGDGHRRVFRNDRFALCRRGGNRPLFRSLPSDRRRSLRL